MSQLPYHWRRRIARLDLAWKKHYRRARLTYQFFQDDLYDFSQRAHPVLKALSIVLGVLVFGSLLIPLAMDSSRQSPVAMLVEQTLLVAFGLHFFTRLLLTPRKKELLRKRWAEGTGATLACAMGLDLLLADGHHLVSTLQGIGVYGSDTLMLLAIQIYLVTLVTIKIIQAIPETIANSDNPAKLILSSFLGVILVGTLLLMLPASTHDRSGLELINALFMSTSAVCVTGLIVVDTATHLSRFGQSVILILIQLGGIGVITFATYLALYLSGGIGVSERSLLRGVVQQDDVRAVSRTLKRIVLFTLGFEGIGAAVYFFSWKEFIPDMGERLFFAVFHTVSAFCNAGFSVFSNSLADPSNAVSLPINIVTMSLIIVGGLGFTTVSELVQKYFGAPATRHRCLSVHSLIVLRMTAGLIVAGTLLVLAIEWHGVLAGYSTSEKFLLSLFQSVTSRTAGFNTLDTGALSAATSLIIMLLMIIGASPSSTAGGLKTTTVYVLFASMIATIQGKDRVEIARRTLPQSVIFRAISATFLAFLILSVCTIILTITEDFPFLDILFEQISAFMTVGLSRGITADLTNIGKLVLVFSMFLGRVGLLTFAVAFAVRSDNRTYSYPEEVVLVN